MAEEILDSETILFHQLTEVAVKWCRDASDAKRYGRRDEAIQCLLRALEQIGLAFLHA